MLQIASYVEQFDSLNGFLTVKENIYYHSELLSSPFETPAMTTERLERVRLLIGDLGNTPERQDLATTVGLSIAACTIPLACEVVFETYGCMRVPGQAWRNARTIWSAMSLTVASVEARPNARASAWAL
eukprot:scaffold4595_cov415-Prasinococcus_capsulatus_cf.AAC.6